ncbi:MAG: ankyrin repeat domain-containing protein [Alphaproteobacteria bacterium]|nr:MAG: ankyrin repeat domain-containing protein [Alphaproteobacteria bacterium]
MQEVIGAETAPETGTDRKSVFNELLQNGIDKRDSEMVALALKNGAEPNILLFAGITYKQSSWDRLRGRNEGLGAEWVRLALEHGADAEATKLHRDERPWPAIHWAQAYFLPAVMDMLIASGAKVDTPSPDGRTPLMDAVKNGFAEEIEYYLQKGADPLYRSADGNTALNMLRHSGQFDRAEQERLIKLMMQHSIPEAQAVENTSAPGKRFSI